MSAIPPDQSQKALKALGVTQTDFDTIRNVPIAEAKTLLKDLKARAHRNYKRLALEYHPDQTKGDAAKTEFWLLLGRVLEELNKTTVQAQPQVPHFETVAYIPVQWTQPGQPITFSAWHQVNKPQPQGFTVSQIRRVVKMRPK